MRIEHYIIAVVFFLIKMHCLKILPDLVVCQSRWYSIKHNLYILGLL